MFKIGSVTIDSLKNEITNFSNEVTSKAVEDGSDITDNIKHNPLKLTATCVLAGSNADQRYKQLKQMSETDKLITYYGSLEPVLKNMAIESVGNKRDVTYSDGFEFDINLIQVKIVNAQTFEYAAPSKEIEGPVKDGGKTQPSAAEVNAESVKSEALYMKLLKLHNEDFPKDVIPVGFSSNQGI